MVRRSIYQKYPSTGTRDPSVPLSQNSIDRRTKALQRVLDMYQYKLVSAYLPAKNRPKYPSPRDPKFSYNEFRQHLELFKNLVKKNASLIHTLYNIPQTPSGNKSKPQPLTDNRIQKRKRHLDSFFKTKTYKNLINSLPPSFLPSPPNYRNNSLSYDDFILQLDAYRDEMHTIHRNLQQLASR